MFVFPLRWASKDAATLLASGILEEVYAPSRSNLVSFLTMGFFRATNSPHRRTSNLPAPSSVVVRLRCYIVDQPSPQNPDRNMTRGRWHTEHAVAGRWASWFLLISRGTGSRRRRRRRLCRTWRVSITRPYQYAAHTKYYRGLRRRLSVYHTHNVTINFLWGALAGRVHFLFRGEFDFGKRLLFVYGPQTLGMWGVTAKSCWFPDVYWCLAHTSSTLGFICFSPILNGTYKRI